MRFIQASNATRRSCQITANRAFNWGTLCCWKNLARTFYTFWSPVHWNILNTNEHKMSTFPCRLFLWAYGVFLVILQFLPKGAISPDYCRLLPALRRAVSCRAVSCRIGCSLHDDGSRSPSSRGHQMTSPVTIATEPNDAHPKLRPHYHRTVPRYAAIAALGSSAHNFL